MTDLEAFGRYVGEQARIADVIGADLAKGRDHYVRAMLVNGAWIAIEDCCAGACRAMQPSGQTVNKEGL